MDRGSRRRAARMTPGEGLAVGPASLSGDPEHWDVDVVTYSHEVDGRLMNELHLHNLATNDLVLAESYALRCVRPLSGAVRDKVRIEEAHFCRDAEHVEKTPAELIGGPKEHAA